MTSFNPWVHLLQEPDVFLYPLEGRSDSRRAGLLLLCGTSIPNSTWINNKCYLRGKPWPVLTALTPIVLLSQDCQRLQAQAWEVTWPHPLAGNRLNQQVVELWSSDPIGLLFPNQACKAWAWRPLTKSGSKRQLKWANVRTQGHWEGGANLLAQDMGLVRDVVSSSPCWASGKGLRLQSSADRGNVGDRGPGSCL